MPCSLYTTEANQAKSLHFIASFSNHIPQAYLHSPYAVSICVTSIHHRPTSDLLLRGAWVTIICCCEPIEVLSPGWSAMKAISKYNKCVPPVCIPMLLSRAVP